MTTLEAQLLLKRSLSNTLPEQVQFGELIILGGGSQLAIVNSDNETATYLKPISGLQITGDATGAYDPSSNSISLALASTGIESGVYTKVAVDSKGRVFGGSDLSATDIPALSSSKISNFTASAQSAAQTLRLDQFAAPEASVSLNGKTITNLGTPENGTDAANKNYVDLVGQSYAVPVVYRVSDANYSIPANADVVLSISQTATRTFTLPAGSSVYNGKRITVRDAVGACWFGMPLIIQRSGSDTINGQTRAFIEFPYGSLTFTYDSAAGWSYEEGQPPRSDSWYLSDAVGHSNNATGAIIQPTQHGLTFTSYSSTNAGGFCLNVSLATSLGSTNGLTFFAGNTPIQLGSGSGTFYLELLTSMDVLMNSTDGRFLMGFINSGNLSVNSEPANGAYIMHNPATHSNWLGRTAASSVRSTVLDSGIAVSTANFHRFAVKLSPGSANFAINRNMFGSIAANIPSGSNQKLSFGVYATRNNVNAGSQAFTYNLYGFRFLYLPPGPR